MSTQKVYSQRQPRDVMSQSRFAELSHHSGQCVCQVCICNKHKCPPSHMHYAPEALKSTMKNDYPPYELGNPANNKRTYKFNPSNYAPDIMKTTHQADFTPKKANAPFRNPREEYIDSNIPFQNESEYKTNYLQKQVIPVNRPSTGKPSYSNNVPFNAKSTYAECYRGQPGQKRDITIPLSQPLVNIPFNGSTTYSQEYHPHELQRPKTVNGSRPAQMSNIPFEGNSSYQNDYKRHQQSAYSKEPCPVEKLPQRPRNCSPGKSHLHYHADIEAWE